MWVCTKYVWLSSLCHSWRFPISARVGLITIQIWAMILIWTQSGIRTIRYFHDPQCIARFQTWRCASRKYGGMAKNQCLFHDNFGYIVFLCCMTHELKSICYFSPFSSIQMTDLDLLFMDGEPILIYHSMWMLCKHWTRVCSVSVMTWCTFIGMQMFNYKICYGISYSY